MHYGSWNPCQIHCSLGCFGHSIFHSRHPSCSCFMEPLHSPRSGTSRTIRASLKRPFKCHSCCFSSVVWFQCPHAASALDAHPWSDQEYGEIAQLVPWLDYLLFISVSTRGLHWQSVLSFPSGCISVVVLTLKYSGVRFRNGIQDC